jgi:hypothetical protein
MPTQQPYLTLKWPVSIGWLAQEPLAISRGVIITQDPVEVVEFPTDEKVRITQLPMETVTNASVTVRLTQEPIEIVLRAAVATGTHQRTWVQIIG